MSVNLIHEQTSNTGFYKERLNLEFTEDNIRALFGHEAAEMKLLID